MSDPAELVDRQWTLSAALAGGWPKLSIRPLPFVSIAAVIGNATQENACRSVTEGTKDHGSDGLFQWRLDRLTNMQTWCTSNFGLWQAIEPQAAFFAYECAKDYPALWADLLNGTKPLATLTLDITDQFERPSADGRVPDKRIAYANEFFALANSQNTIVDKAQPSAPVPAIGADPELAAIGEILSILRPFDAKTMERILAYLTERSS